MSLSSLAIKTASRIWRALGLHRTPLKELGNKLTHLTVPIGLRSPYGLLYGWNVHEMLHTPEAETVAFFKKHLKAGDRIADIGANIGFYTLQFSSLVGEEGRVVAFEPSPYAYRCLARAVKGRKNVELVQKGVYADERTLTLYARRGGDGMASVMYEVGDKQTSIKVIPLKNYPEDFTWAKIDVEGAELDVLRGMGKRINCVVEVAKGIQEEHGGGVQTFLDSIEQLGYRIHFIVADGNTIPYDHQNLSVLENNIYLEPV